MVFFVTHLFDPAHGFYEQELATALFLRAERQPDGRRTFRVVEGEPVPTSYGEDAYRRVSALRQILSRQPLPTVGREGRRPAGRWPARRGSRHRTSGRSGEAAWPTLGSAGRRPPWVSPEVASIGAASFFSDAGHEIATAVLPSFLTGVLRGSAATLGLIQGRLELGSLRRAGLFRPLLPVALFELGNITTTLLILQATQLLKHGGRSPTAAASVAILLYAGHNLTAAIVALAGGTWTDRRGPRTVFAAGAAASVLAYGGSAFPSQHWLLAGCFCLAGAGIGLAETAESTLVAHLLPEGLRGSGFGLLGGLQSAGDLLSSTIVGLL